MSTETRRPDRCVTHEYLKRLLDYDPETGVFTWKVSRSWRTPVGSVAGSKPKNGKPISIGIDGTHYLAHQLAWFYVHAAWAGCEIDHKNGVNTFNAIKNLRPVTRNGNVQNSRVARKNNKGSGLLGAYRGNRGRWFSTICADGVSKYLGTFDTADEAHIAYVAAKRTFHATCTI